MSQMFTGREKPSGVSVTEHHDFWLSGNRIGVLLIHGLTGTPTEMRGVGRELNRLGYTVSGVQLAGHCGSVSDLNATDWQAWYRSVTEAAGKLQQQVDYLFIGGLSMGALLALKYAADFPHQVQGVLVYGATFKYDGWGIPAIWQNTASWILPLTHALRIDRFLMFNEKPPYGIRNEKLRKRLVQSMLSGDSVSAGLPGNPWPALYQMQKLSRQTRAALPRVTAPCLILHAEDDDVAHYRNGELVRDNVSASAQLILLKNSHHMITIDNDRDELVACSAAFIQQQCQRRDVA